MTKPEAPWILGLSFSHNGSACLLHGDTLVVAMQEERLTRGKRQKTGPARRNLAVRYCLEHAGIGMDELDAIAFASLKPVDETMDELRQNPQFCEAFETTPVYGYSHHRTHAGYAAGVTGVEQATILVADGMGSGYNGISEEEQDVVAAVSAPVKGRKIGLAEMLSIFRFEKGKMIPLFKQMTPRLDEGLYRKGPNSVPGTANRFGLGAMYERSSEVIFGGSQQAGKVMGLAPLGAPDMPVEAFHEPRADGALIFHNPPALQLDYTRERPGTLDIEATATRNLAASVQRALEDGMLHYAGLAATLAPADTLVLAGGVALNGVANERILRELDYDEVHFPPAVEDSGNSVGAAYLALWEMREEWQRGPRLQADRAGRTYTLPEIDDAIARFPYLDTSVLGANVYRDVAARLIDGEILGWFQEGAELGPRALGQRSILCDPRPAEAKDRLNARVKHREAYRPFAPIVLAEHAREWFDLPDDVDPHGPFMTRVIPIRPEKRALIPAVTHVDGTGRFQTVSEANGPIHALVKAFYEATGVPVLLNTSFNVAGEPIVETPGDALFDLLTTDLDGVVLTDRLVRRAHGRPPGLGDFTPVLLGRRLDGAEKAHALAHEVTMNSIDEFAFDDMCYRCETALGPVHVKLDHVTMPLLALVDGNRTLREIADQTITLDVDPRSTPAYRESVMLTLVRKKLLGLRGPDGTLLSY